jgi:hypothetical protein
VTQIALVKPLAELCCQRLPQLRQQTLPIGRTLRSALLKLDNVPPDMPVGLHLSTIHCSQHLRAGIGNELTQGAKQGRQACRCNSGDLVGAVDVLCFFPRHAH